jgi:hypothetical protein
MELDILFGATWPICYVVLLASPWMGPDGNFICNSVFVEKVPLTANIFRLALSS